MSDYLQPFTVNTDIVKRLDYTIDCLSLLQPPCECDPSVGYQCHKCGEELLLKDAKKEIVELRQKLKEQ